MSYFSNLFVAIDQLLNTVAGGNPDNTISARIGYYNFDKSQIGNTKWYWKWFMKIVDTTFSPIDGKGHCDEAYHNDAGESFDKKTKNWAIGILMIIIIPTCTVIGVILHILKIIGLVKPKTIDRYQNITFRIEGVQRKVKGCIFEIQHHGVISDEKLKLLSKNTIVIVTKLNKML